MPPASPSSLDRNTAEGRALARQAYKKAPNDPGVAVTYAFSLYGTGRTAEVSNPAKSYRRNNCAIHTSPSMPRFSTTTKACSNPPINISPSPETAPSFRRKNNFCRR